MRFDAGCNETAFTASVIKIDSTLTVLPLSPGGWSDRQIVKRFNETGNLTLRGRKWSPRRAFSIRKKYEKRLAELSGER